MRARRIAVATTSRADYGLLRGLLLELDAEPDFELELLVSGSHLEEAFGCTVNEIEADGLSIARRIPLGLAPTASCQAGASAMVAAEALARATAGFTCALTDLRPDLALVLGDRFELLGVAQAALLTRTPLAHVHGGERTEGAMDELVRHAVTKLAHLHFVAAEAYGRRVLQLGEPAERVFVVGAPGLDAPRRACPLPELRAGLGLELARPFVLATLHPVTLDPDESDAALAALLGALDRLPELDVIFTAPGADPGCESLRARVEAWTRGQPGRAHFFPSLGRDRYLSLLERAAVVAGNSSSGILEAPALGVPSVNVGSRQGGRLRALSVIDAAPDFESVAEALATALRGVPRDPSPPYGAGGAVRRILATLRTVELGDLLRKPFVDLGEGASRSDATRRAPTARTSRVVA